MHVSQLQVIGHRGAAALAPENTWEGFDLALSLGVDAIETDIRATSDGELVLLHDRRLDRTTNGQGAIDQTPWAVVQTLDAGAWFNPQYQQARVPRLRDTLERYSGRTHLVLEVKQANLEAAVLEQVHACHLLQTVTFTAFEFETVQRIKALAPMAKVGWLTADTSPAAIDRVVAAGFEQICLPAAQLTAGQVADLHAIGLEVRAWKVTDVAAMQAALQAQVDGMTIDFPDQLLAILDR